MSELVTGVAASPCVELELPGLAPEYVQLQESVHLATITVSESDEYGRLRGETAWRCTVGARTAMIAWEWVEFQAGGGVLMLADPNNVCSNFLFVDPVTGTTSDQLRRTLLLNTVIHGLRWQHRVLAEISRRGRAGEQLLH